MWEHGDFEFISTLFLCIHVWLVEQMILKWRWNKTISSKIRHETTWSKNEIHQINNEIQTVWTPGFASGCIEGGLFKHIMYFRWLNTTFNALQSRWTPLQLKGWWFSPLMPRWLGIWIKHTELIIKWTGALTATLPALRSTHGKLTRGSEDRKQNQSSAPLHIEVWELKPRNACKKKSEVKMRLRAGASHPGIMEMHAA